MHHIYIKGEKLGMIRYALCLEKEFYCLQTGHENYERVLFSRERFVFCRHCHWSDFISISTNLKNNSVNTVYAKISLTELEWGN